MAVVVTCIRDKELFHGVTEAKKMGVRGWGQQRGGDEDRVGERCLGRWEL